MQRSGPLHHPRFDLTLDLVDRHRANYGESTRKRNQDGERQACSSRWSSNGRHVTVSFEVDAVPFPAEALFRRKWPDFFWRVRGGRCCISAVSSCLVAREQGTPQWLRGLPPEDWQGVVRTAALKDYGEPEIAKPQRGVLLSCRAAPRRDRLRLLAFVAVWKSP